MPSLLKGCLLRLPVPCLSTLGLEPEREGCSTGVAKTSPTNPSRLPGHQAPLHSPPGCKALLLPNVGDSCTAITKLSFSEPCDYQRASPESPAGSQLLPPPPGHCYCNCRGRAAPREEITSLPALPRANRASKHLQPEALRGRRPAGLRSRTHPSSRLSRSAGSPYARSPHLEHKAARAGVEALRPSGPARGPREPVTLLSGAVRQHCAAAGPSPCRHGGTRAGGSGRGTPLALTCVAMATPRQRLAPCGGAGGMTTNMAERSRTAETGQ